MPALAPGNFSKPMGKETREFSLHRLEKAEFSWPRDQKVQCSRSTEERILIVRFTSRDIILTPKGTALDSQARGNTEVYSPLKLKQIIIPLVN